MIILFSWQATGDYIEPPCQDFESGGGAVEVYDSD
jgi:hypothetical protein